MQESSAPVMTRAEDEAARMRADALELERLREELRIKSDELYERLEDAQDEDAE